jgi:hypothetical protein
MEVKLHGTNCPCTTLFPETACLLYSLHTKLSGTLKSLECEVLSLLESHRDLPGRTESLCTGRGILRSEAFTIRRNPTGTHTNITEMEQIWVCVCASETSISRNPPTYSLKGDRQNLTDPKHTNT